MFGATIQLVALTVFFALIFGGVCGVALARLQSKWRAVLQVAVALPLALPPTLVAAAFLEWSRLPPLRSLASLGAERALPVPPVLVAALVLAACFFPTLALPLGTALRAVPREQDEAARLFGSPLQRRAQVLARAVAPALAAGCGLVAALALWEMGAPDLLDVRTYSVQIYRDLSAADALAPAQKSARAAIAALPLSLLAALALWPAWRAFDHRAASTLQAEREEQHAPSNFARASFMLSALIVAFATLAPIAVFARRWEFGVARQVAQANAAEITNTIVAATLSATLNTALALALVLVWRSWPAKWRSAAKLILCAPLLCAPVVVGVALLGWSNTFAGDWLAAGWTSTWAPLDWAGAQVSRYGLLGCGFALRFLPVCVWILDAAFATRDGSLEEAASGLGASTWQTTRDVSIALARPWIASAWALAWVLSAGELSLAVLVNAPGGQTLPVPIFNLMHIGATPEVAALSLFALAQAGTAVALALWLASVKSPKMKRR
jgi:iron(III) transport system permease protein